MRRAAGSGVAGVLAQRTVPAHAPAPLGEFVPQGGEPFGVAGGEPPRVVEVHGARGGGVDEPFEDGCDLVGALGMPGEGGQFGGGAGTGDTASARVR
ncbi:hypothetical protein STENM327S_09370 [Streptomyces tendae]